MTREQMIAAITLAIQTDSNTIILMRALITNNLPNVSMTQLTQIMTTLGLPIT